MSDKTIESVCRQIVEKFSPERIILFSRKNSPSNVLSSFQLRVIIDGGDPDMTEHDIYMDIDCAVPFDALVYTSSDFDGLSGRSGSFARRIAEEGSVLYERPE